MLIYIYMSRFRAWCFTINNPTSQDEFAVRSLGIKPDIFLVYAPEIGESGTPHIQGYYRPKSPLSLANLKKTLSRAHLTVSNGTDQDNLSYIAGPYEKDGKVKPVNPLAIVIGEPKAGQGSRNDIKDVANLIKTGEISMTDLMFEYPELYLKYSRGLEKMFQATLKARNTLPEVNWRWGLAGVGKSRYCVDKHPSHYIKDNTIWWDMYEQQEAVIIDDFDNNIPFRVLLRILDRYAYPCQIKGGYTQLNSPFIYITAEHPPEHFWSGNELAQVARRLTSVLEIN